MYTVYNSLPTTTADAFDLNSLDARQMVEPIVVTVIEPCRLQLVQPVHCGLHMMWLQRICIAALDATVC